MSDATALTNYEEQLMKEMANVKASLSQPSSNKISTKGKMFTLPDGTTNPGPMQCIILDWISYNSYYEGVYDPANPQAPVCWALNKVLDDLQPSPNCPTPQAESCKACPKDKFGSHGKGKACKNVRRLIVVAPDATIESNAMTLEVSPGAIRTFDNYALGVQRTLNTLPIRVITSIGFDANKAYPSLTFENPQLHENLSVMMQLREKFQHLLEREPEGATQPENSSKAN